jgi:predicted NAD/FAD-binding protein
MTRQNWNACHSAGDDMKIAIVGTGIAGNVVAHRLRQDHDITVFESGAYVGGHTNTVDVYEDGKQFAVDTGFIVFNDRTYPNFIRILDEIGQESQQSEMSFSVQQEHSATAVLSDDSRHFTLQRNGFTKSRQQRRVRNARGVSL